MFRLLSLTVLALAGAASPAADDPAQMQVELKKSDRIIGTRLNPCNKSD